MPAFIEPDWPAPANVMALSTTRRGGCSAAPFDSFNLGHHVGDEEVAVAVNRQVLVEALPAGTEVPWLSQVHGIDVIQAGQGGLYPEADAVFSREGGIACAVMTADCLPVLLCSTDGAVVAAAHAGWRGLQAGVLEATVEAMAEAPDRLLAWLGPAIGPAAFEVGAEVLAQFVAVESARNKPAVEACFKPLTGRHGRYLADIYALARLRLARAGVSRVFGGDFCTYSAPQQFYSYRRDGCTGRMASVVLLR